ncbi:ABC transporter ATP-binding protein [Pusillimonas sp. DMV24BSW_D]|jgi:branched-chain amino acid transport system ATP-binding protein|uniref:ABC transporter ATP-binding protein n=1 Tax=Neopusillimonas aestuarii TaxID=2716226 RepID=UPI00140AF304|nr:ABC transporter ATP-binding protein [Pusillimonas sp. DMV24BSW_D]QIM47849.1 ABC transporter ATP-binding protein [Pusillimonas sp. DMV24BSW_D]|tara:strand:+ start:1753 stop:2451 length:699 start_codon:yes stop_codon:yes gene_type:complete
MLELDAISTRYGVVNILNKVSLKVDEGSVVCLLGPNGAGKTTTFKAIAGLLRPYEGQITICGRKLADIKTEDLAGLGVGFVPEGRRLFPEISVRENLQIGYDALKPKDSFKQALERVVELFPRVGERLAQDAGTLSGGEQAMVALGRVLIGNPKMVVMDEPTLGLSPKLIEEYFMTVERIHKEGITVLLIEQNAEAALSIAHSGYLLLKGQIVASGSAKELLSNDVIKHLYL